MHPFIQSFDLMGLPSASLLLDGFSTKIAYSLQKLRASYTGQAIKVRRDSDNTLLDIGFASNSLDEAALLSFVGSGNGFIHTYYDQSGNNLYVSNATFAEQPQIVAAGAVLKRNGNPCAKFAGNRLFFNGNTTTNTQIFNTNSSTTFAVSQLDIVDGRNHCVFGAAINGSGSDSYVLMANSYGTVGGSARGSYAVVADTVNTSAKTYVLTSDVGNSLTTFRTGGLSSSLAASTAYTVGGACLGGLSTRTDYNIYGGIGAFIVIDTVLTTAQINQIGAAISATYGATWTNY